MSGNPRHLSKGRSLTKAGGNGLRLEPNRTNGLGKSSSGKISIDRRKPTPEAGKKKPKRVSVILQTLTSLVGPKGKENNPPGLPETEPT